jgi:thiol:disulfide interchange protein DsbD
MRSLLTTLLTSLFLVAPSFAQDAPGGGGDAQTPALDPSTLVSVDLVSPVGQIRPGEEFLVGVRLRMEEGYHVYWRNPGDSGVPTEVQLRVPPGFKVGPPLFPAPWRLEQAGGLMAYGYEKEFVCFFQVTAPAELPNVRQSVFHGGARWLVCKTVCYPGRGVGELKLRHAKGKKAQSKNNAQRSEVYLTLLPHLARLPRPLPNPDAWKLRWTGTENKPMLVLHLPKDSKAEYFPLEDDQNRFVRTRSNDRVLTIIQSFQKGDQTTARVKGVLLVSQGEQTICYEINRTWKDAPFVAPKQPTQKEE